MDNKQLKLLQEVELEILRFVHNFCIEHEIEYFLYAGTALGAVRHSGFIPWDDDVDIVMNRDNFDKFQVEWKRASPKGYFFQDPLIEKEIPINHVKIRKDNTIFLSEGEENYGHKGIWLDIFVLDKVPSNRVSIVFYRFRGMISQIFKRKYPAKNKGKIIYYITKILTSLPDELKWKIFLHSNEKLKKYNYLEKNFCWILSNGCMDDLFLTFPCDVFSEHISIKFENHNFYINKNYDDTLRIQYGAYLKLPPLEERVCKHKLREFRI